MAHSETANMRLAGVNPRSHVTLVGVVTVRMGLIRFSQPSSRAVGIERRSFIRNVPRSRGSLLNIPLHSGEAECNPDVCGSGMVRIRFRHSWASEAPQISTSSSTASPIGRS
jgi:hypothetical protein